MSRFFFLLSFLWLGSPFLPAQNSAPAEKPLVADPSQGLFDLASLYYNEATSAKNKEEQEKNFHLAATKFDRYLRDFPKSKNAPEAWYFLGLTYQKIAKIEPAMECFEVAAQTTHPKFAPAAAAQLASFYFEADDWARAARWLAVLAAKTDQDKVRHESLYRRVLCFDKLKNEAELEKALQAVIADRGNPYAEVARLGLARFYHQNKKEKAALPLYESLVGSKDQKMRADAILQAALIAQKLKDAEKTLRWFTLAFDEPGLADLRGQTQLTLMNIHYQGGQFQKAIDLFKRGQFKLEKKAAIQRLIIAAKSHEALKQNDEALKFYAQIDKIDPSAASGIESSYRTLLNAYNKKSPDFIAKGEEFLQKQSPKHAGDPRLQSVHLMLASAHYLKKNYQNAITHYEALDLKKVAPENLADIRYALSLCYFNLKKDADALAALNDFLTKHPKDSRFTRSQLRRAETNYELKKYDDALEDYRVLLRDNPPRDLRILILQRASQIYKDQKNYDRFVLNQKALLNIAGLPDKTVASARYWIGWNEYRIKNYPGAIEELTLARKIDASFTGDAAAMLIRSAYYQEDAKNLEEEIKIARQAERDFSVPPPISRWLGATLAKEKEFARAWPHLVEGMKETKGDAAPSEVHWQLYLETALQTGHHQEALEAAETLLAALNITPYRKATLLLDKSRALLGLRKFEEATKAASDALELRPQGQINIDLRLHAGDIAFAEGDFDEASRHYLTVASLYAKTPETEKIALEKAIKALDSSGTPESKKEATIQRKKLDSVVSDGV